MKKLLAMPEVGSRRRIRLYISTMLFQWALAAFIAWRALARGFSPVDFGMANGSKPVVVAATVVGSVLIVFGHWANLRRMARMKHPAVDALRAMATRIFPRSAGEFVLYIGLAATAGICEEFIFRGFVIAALWRAGLATWAVVLASSAMFGIAHLYQGRGGTLGTGILGIIFAVVRIAYYSLLPVVVWHAVLDITAGVAGRRFLVVNPAEEAVLHENPQ